MSVTQYPASWYPDPNLPPGSLRWWDGSQWTQHIHVAPTVQHVPPTTGAASMAVTAPVAATTATPGYGAPAYAAGAGAAVHPATLGATGPAQSAPQSASALLLDANPKSLTAIGVVAAYLLIAVTTGVVLLGIFPVLLSIRALRRGEQLAPVAMAAAALAVFVALSSVPHH